MGNSALNIEINTRSSLSDQELFALVQASDKKAYEEIYNRYWGLLYLHALKMLKDEDEAKDVIQELFTTLWLNSNQIKLRTSLSSYLYTSVRNRILNIFEHQKIKQNYLASLNDFNEDYCPTADWIRERELTLIIEKEIVHLPSKMRKVFELSRQANFSYKEIAQQLNISDKTVKKQISNAVRILKSKIYIIVVLLQILLNILHQK